MRNHMKHPLITLSMLALVACSKPVTNTQPSIPADTLLMDIMHAIVDSNCSCLDIADEFYMFIDTMQYHAESYPDENIRIGAKSLSMEICNLFMSDMFCTPCSRTKVSLSPISATKKAMTFTTVTYLSPVSMSSIAGGNETVTNCNQLKLDTSA